MSYRYFLDKLDAVPEAERVMGRHYYIDTEGCGCAISLCLPEVPAAVSAMPYPAAHMGSDVDLLYHKLHDVRYAMDKAGVSVDEAMHVQAACDRFRGSRRERFANVVRYLENRVKTEVPR